MKTIIFIILIATGIVNAQPKGAIGSSREAYLKLFSNYELETNNDSTVAIENYKCWGTKGLLIARFRNDSLIGQTWLIKLDGRNMENIYNGMKKKFGKASRLYENRENEAWWFLNNEAWSFNFGEEELTLTHIKI